MSVRIAITLVAAVLLMPTVLFSQQRRFTLSPEYAGDISDFAGAPHWGGTIKTLAARLEIRSAEALSPWVTTGLILFDAGCVGPTCLDNGWLLVSGVRIDALRAATLRAYVVAGVGAAVYNRDTIELLPSAGAGVRLEDRGGLVPHLEIRWERYADRSYAMLGAGLGFVVGRPVNAFR